MTPYQSGTTDARIQPGGARQQHCARQLALPTAANAPGLARRATRDALTAWRMTHLEETAVLLVSELVTNVVLHAQAFPAFMMLRLETADSWLRIGSTRDADPSWPRPLHSGLPGRGPGFGASSSCTYWPGPVGSPRGAARQGAVWAELNARSDREARIATAR